MSEIEVYSTLSRDQAIDLEGKNISHPRLRAFHLSVVEDLVVMDVEHLSLTVPNDPNNYTKKLRRGQVVVHGDMAYTYRTFFEGLLDIGYPIQQFAPASQVKDSQDKYLMRLNWSHIYRPGVVGDPDDPNAPISLHGFGIAADVNQLHNPIVTADHRIDPPEASGQYPHLGMVLLRYPEISDLAAELDLECGNDWPDPRFPNSYAGIDSDGQPRHILRDSHHYEPIKPIVDGLNLPREHAA